MGHNEFMFCFYNRLGVTFARINELPNCLILSSI